MSGLSVSTRSGWTRAVNVSLAVTLTALVTWIAMLACLVLPLGLEATTLSYLFIGSSIPLGVAAGMFALTVMLHLASSASADGTRMILVLTGSVLLVAGALTGGMLAIIGYGLSGV